MDIECDPGEVQSRNLPIQSSLSESGRTVACVPAKFSTTQGYFAGVNWIGFDQWLQRPVASFIRARTR